MAERRFLGQDVGSAIGLCRGDDGEDEGRITGYAAVYYDGKPETEFQLWPGSVERVMPGAFDRAVKEDDVRALFNHNPDNLLGRTTSGTLELKGDKRGLRYLITPAETSMAQDVRAMIKRGELTGSSFSFEITDEVWKTEDEVDIREITGVRLFDVGPVTFPAYAGTTVTTRDKAAADKEDAAFRSWMKYSNAREAEALRIRRADQRRRRLDLITRGL